MPVSTTLRGRVPGQVVIGDIVAAQQDVAPRSRLARIFGLSPLTPTNRGLYRAALGEVAVGEMLDQLGPKWDILHVVPIVPASVHAGVAGYGAASVHATGLHSTGFDAAGFDAAGFDAAAFEDEDAAGLQIDHLVIGPPGVFAITTENYPGQEVRITGDVMTIGGREVGDIRSARRLAAAAGERLSAAAGRTVHVEPVIVVIDSGKLVLRESPRGVTVITSRNLLRLLTKIDRTLTGSEVAYISDVADRDTTWESAPTAPDGALALSAEFGVLRDQVRDATQLRIFWIVVAFAAVCATAWIATIMVVESLML